MSIQKNSFAAILPLLGWMAAGAAAQEKKTSGDLAKPNKKNVLFIAVDDLNNDLHCYRHPLVKSPHIDRLAARGVRFDRAYCQYPVCNPSRSSFLTGMYPDQTGVLRNSGDFRKKWPHVATLPQHFQKHGYYTARVGKIYHYGVPTQIGTDGADDPASWNQVINPRGRDKDDEHKIQSIAPHRNFGGTLSWLAAEGTDDEQTDAIGAAAAIQLLEKFLKQKQTFFLAVGFYRPHTPFVAPIKYFDMYPLKKIQLVKEPANDLEDIPHYAWVDRPYQQQMSKETQRKVLQAYYASITFMDAQVGRLLDALDRLGLFQNTVIVFVSDHGYHMGEHQLWQKSSLFENSARVPLIVSAPGAKGNGKATRAIAELVDLYPTLCDLCGLPQPDHLPGRSLAANLDDPSKPGKKAALTQVISRIRKPPPNSKRKPDQDRAKNRRAETVHGYSIRTDRYRYTEWAEGKRGIELYDHQNDPREFVNLATQPDYLAKVHQLHRLLAETKTRAKPKANE